VFPKKKLDFVVPEDIVEKKSKGKTI